MTIITNNDIIINFTKDINTIINTFINDTNSDYYLYLQHNEPNKHVVNINDNIKNFITKNILFSIKKFDNFDNELKNDDFEYYLKHWNICIYKNMFFNLPFTLANVIFLPINYIENANNNANNDISTKFIKTLIHEKIHILQRNNQTIWNKYIEKYTNWIQHHNKLIEKSSLLNNNKIIYNPDTYYSPFILKNNDKSYFCNLYVDKKSNINNLWYCIINSNLYPLTLQINKYEHPYEELAYVISDKLMN